jgi:prephenate dehydratase
MRGFRTEETSNTAVAAKAVANSGDISLGAIASARTAELYGLKIIESDINKSGENTTRFAVLSRVKATSPTLSSTVLMFTVKHEAGSLANAIGIIARYGYNMTALRSRPMKKHSWQYYFYVEIDGVTDTEKGKKMIEELSTVCDRLKVAGTFAPHTEI